MQQFSQKYTIIQLFEAVPEGATFVSSDWPLHSTVVDTFAIDWDVPTMIANLEQLLAACTPVSSIAEDDTFFGTAEQTQVTLLRKTESLTALHNEIVVLLEKGGLKLNDPQFAHEGFLPHATVQKHARLHKGDKAVFDALTIIDMFPDNDPYKRRMIKTIGDWY